MKQMSGFCGKFLITSILVLLANTGAKAQQELDVIRNWIHFSDAPNSLYHHLAGQVYELMDKRSEAVAALGSLKNWQNRQQWLHKTLAEIVGPFPAKTPLQAKVTRVINKDGYRLENILYESRPGFYVTASLFIPGGLKDGMKAPAILYCSGHSNTGYRSAAYQHVILNLVKKGFIVLAFDPVGQGERLEYYDAGTGRSRHKWPTQEHSYPGAQVFITGNSLANYMIWDGIRAIDYLLIRKETDPQRIGITGRSGGGTQSAYIAAMDNRIKAAAPENYITSFTRLFQSAGPQDAEQNLFKAIRRGTDIGDLLLVRAPKPALMITTTRDMFSIQGSMETAKEVTDLYAAYGKKDAFKMVTDDAPHASTKKNREALYAFFQKYLDQPGTPEDEKVAQLSAEELRVSETGQVATSLKGETIFSLNLKEAEERHARLQASRKKLPAHFPAILAQAKNFSGYRQPAEKAEPVFTGRIRREGYVIEKMFVKGEGDYVIPYLIMKPDNANHKAVIFLHPSGKSANAAAGGEMEWFVKNGFTVLAPDMIGTGETGPGAFKGDSYIDSISYNIWFAAMQVGRSITGIQAGDVVRLTRVLREAGNIKEVYGLAKKEMAPVLLHAAAFDTAITRIALIAPYISYHSIVTNRIYNPDFIQSTVPGALGVYDLPDLAASLAPRKLMIAGSTDGNGNSVQSDAEDLSVIRAAYQYHHAGDRLQIIPAEPVEKIYDRYKAWISL